jgi:hypothetical protein
MSNSNKEAAEANLKAASIAGVVTEDDETAPIFAAVVGIGFALLDVADAIREQTLALTGDDKRAILIERDQ